MSTPPERFVALWRGVVAQAVLDLVYPEVEKATPEERAAAYDWLTSDDTSRFSFLWVCDMADLEPDEPRRRLREAGIL